MNNLEKNLRKLKSQIKPNKVILENIIYDKPSAFVVGLRLFAPVALVIALFIFVIVGKDSSYDSFDLLVLEAEASEIGFDIADTDTIIDEEVDLLIFEMDLVE